MTSKERAAFKTKAMQLDSIFQIGKSSLTPQMVDAIRDALKARELIKISVLKNCLDDPREIAQVLSERTGSEVVQVIGKKIVLYKKNYELEEKRKRAAKKKAGAAKNANSQAGKKRGVTKSTGRQNRKKTGTVKNAVRQDGKRTGAAKSTARQEGGRTGAAKSTARQEGRRTGALRSADRQNKGRTGAITGTGHGRRPVAGRTLKWSDR